MKRYISLILISILTLGIIVLLFYLMLRQDNSYITYIKLQVNPSFVIGINSNKKVVFYNALNEDGNKYNLEMFQGKGLDEATRVFISKLGNAQEDKNEINLTVMTKNNILEQEIVNIIAKEIKEFDSNYIVIAHEATYEEMERYSNEAIYNIAASLKNNDLKIIGKLTYDKVLNYVNSRIKSLNLSKMPIENQIELLKEKVEEGYFNSYSLSNMRISEYNVILLEKSSYSVDFKFNEDNSYKYEIILYLEVEHEKNELKNIVEVYTYTYELGEGDGIISNLKKYFYTF